MTHDVKVAFVVCLLVRRPKTGGRHEIGGALMSATGIDEAKLEAFMGQAVTDMGAIISAPLMLIGEKLGLYKRWLMRGP